MALLFIILRDLFIRWFKLRSASVEFRRGKLFRLNNFCLRVTFLGINVAQNIWRQKLDWEGGRGDWWRQVQVDMQDNIACWHCLHLGSLKCLSWPSATCIFYSVLNSLAFRYCILKVTLKWLFKKNYVSKLHVVCLCALKFNNLWFCFVYSFLPRPRYTCEWWKGWWEFWTRQTLTVQVQTRILAGRKSTDIL